MQRSINSGGTIGTTGSLTSFQSVSNKQLIASDVLSSLLGKSEGNSQGNSIFSELLLKLHVALKILGINCMDEKEEAIFDLTCAIFCRRLISEHFSQFPPIG